MTGKKQQKRFLNTRACENVKIKKRPHVTSALLPETEVGQVETIGSDSRRENLTSQMEQSQDGYILTLSRFQILRFDERRSETDRADVRNRTLNPGFSLSNLHTY